MTKEASESLLDLQKLDLELAGAGSVLEEFEARLEVVAEPYAKLDKEAASLQKRLKELNLDERRVELAAAEKRERLKKLDERMQQVRNLREEAAVHAEQDLVRRAVEADEQEGLSLLDLIRRTDERLAEVSVDLDEARIALEPHRQEILTEQGQAEDHVSGLEARRSEFAANVLADELRIYDHIRSGKREVAVSPMTPDGACGHCYAMVPLQVRNELRAGARLVRCEGCGVILAPPLSEEELQAEAEVAAARAAEKAAETAEAEPTDEEAPEPAPEEVIRIPSLGPEAGADAG